MHPNSEKGLHRIKKSTVADAVMEEIKRLIEEGALRKGDKLPPEHELARRLGVGRSSVREALKGLAAAGLVSRNPEGTFVSSCGQSLVEPLRYRAILENMTFRELLEARRLLELEFAALAAVRRTPEDIGCLSDAIANMKASIETDVSRFIEADLKFHMGIASAARNRVLYELFAAVRHLLAEAHSRLVEECPTIKQSSIEHHSRILEYIAERNPDKARNAMAMHLSEVETVFDKVVDEGAPLMAGALRCLE
ncbi:MAG: FadR/GntR family transcriptional regulator [Bacillota bacterium]